MGPKHGRVMIVSGDRESEVRYLADQVGITEIRAQTSPEEKLNQWAGRSARKSSTFWQF
jgi:cation transport ATPase